MKMSAKQDDHRNFINSLRSRLNVDDQTIANLELRMTGKSHLASSPHYAKIWPYRFLIGRVWGSWGTNFNFAEFQNLPTAI